MSTPRNDRIRFPGDDEIRPTWVEIDLSAFDRNLAAVAAKLPPGMRTIAVLKADAYGHGAVELAQRCAPELVGMIATATIEEALELRRAHIRLPILALGPGTRQQLQIALDANITLGVPGPEELSLIADIAQEREVVIHLKLDSGMGRMGCVESDLPRVAELLRSAPAIRVEAIYTHLANAGNPADPFTKDQVARFHTLIETLREAGITAENYHLSNSSTTLSGAVMEGNFIRVGLLLLGGAPLDGSAERLEPVMRWRSEIARLKDLPPGHAVGYGTTFFTTRPSRIATLPVGYADGYARAFSNRGEVLVRGRRAPVVGRVSMDLVTIDVTDIPDAQVGDEVVLLGAQGDDEISAEELAKKLDTISYEIFCNVSSRVPRLYLDGDVVRIRSRFEL